MREKIHNINNFLYIIIIMRCNHYNCRIPGRCRCAISKKCEVLPQEELFSKGDSQASVRQASMTAFKEPLARQMQVSAAP